MLLSLPRDKGIKQRFPPLEELALSVRKQTLSRLALLFPDAFLRRIPGCCYLAILCRELRAGVKDSLLQMMDLALPGAAELDAHGQGGGRRHANDEQMKYLLMR